LRPFAWLGAAFASPECMEPSCRSRIVPCVPSSCPKQSSCLFCLDLVHRAADIERNHAQQIVVAQLSQQRLAAALDYLVRQAELSLDESVDLLFHGAPTDELVNQHVALLPYAI